MARKIILKIFLVSCLLLLVSVSAAQAQSVIFRVDQGFDQYNRTQLTATLQLEGQKAQYYIEDTYWNGQSGTSRAQILSTLDDVSSSFDGQIYPAVTGVFGSEWNPGIDGSSKITILISDLKNGIGGYFRDNDEHPKTVVADSNEREMFYMNTDFLGASRQLKAFAAHEFQHLINYNQKNRLRNANEEVWLNELASEIAPSIAGLNQPYSGSNLQSRVSTFLDEASNPLTRWSGQSGDYGIVSVFGNYLRDHYGDTFFTNITQNSLTGFNAINNSLALQGKIETYPEVFRNWAVAVLLNNCNVLPANTFCYLNPDLGYDNLHIQFDGGVESGSSFTNTYSSYPWEGRWYSYERDIQPKPDDHIFTFTFNNNSNSEFTLPYVVYSTDGAPKVYYLEIESGRGKFYVENFGYTVSKVVAMPINAGLNSDFQSSFTVTATTTTTVPADITESTHATEFEPALPEGALVREYGRAEVYIIKNGYKRWIPAPQIIDMYGHLRWEDIITVPAGTLGDYQISDVIRYANDPRVYRITNNGTVKTWITSEAEFTSLGYKFDMVYEINEKEFNFYPTI
ncbi:MAG: hypothetical protein A2919_02195 [Candidatus Spechtbacteria bacterium RIFCSPLOWO2_01_FULL_43_12]|uniref:Peptidase M6-like domain-containing protein n=1 Tax=Candidatus Spechtbacteria bacterium RIFCSPLOWO2_01_FULL_43_12 TaxID=1802162 RepID=A0A1G2HEX0_9BACT|nr:MAG: hypothetical protein A2919_02195 [Candidatus Spechtbacteria bacterium RIFCSPLOWO2_01_FULL_43_12]